MSQFNYEKALYKSLINEKRKLIDNCDAIRDFETLNNEKLKFK